VELLQRNLEFAMVELDDDNDEQPVEVNKSWWLVDCAITAGAKVFLGTKSLVIQNTKVHTT